MKKCGMAMTRIIGILVILAAALSLMAGAFAGEISFANLTAEELLASPQHALPRVVT